MTGGGLGMKTLDQSLRSLVDNLEISADVAREEARSPENF